MRERAIMAVVGGALLICGHLPARAGPFDNRPKILIHLAAPTAKNPCTDGRLADCLTAQTAGDLSAGTGPFYFAYLLAVKGNLPDMGGMVCGIDYDQGPSAGPLDGSGVDIMQWMDCVEVPFVSPEPPWPAPGSGNILPWINEGRCETAETVVGGYFYLAAYTPDTLRVVPDAPAANMLGIGLCDGVTNDLLLSDAGWAAFTPGGATPGCNPCLAPCLATPVTPATWGRIKLVGWPR